MALRAVVTAKTCQAAPFVPPACLGAANLPGRTRPHGICSPARCVRTRAAQTQVATEKDVASINSALKEAIAAEDYALAARLRDELQRLPQVELQACLQRAVEQEDYAEAARLRDRLLALQPPPPPTSSDTVTAGIRVTVQSRYAKPKSSPGHNYVFTYSVTIQNEGSATVQLRNRRWAISNDATGATEEIRGPGVVGEQPVLSPGEAFNYSSYCQLPTPAGSMEGSYEFTELKQGRPVRTFDVVIGRFALVAAEE
ncbi:hypothetical protein WJX81_007518 [Elliptochloris bilobata]|uniref:ApaG domain-containing protein n=1 Tax=Elliptochloris bilobata TaxID=381761 RepID=A0AAW1SE50_9CHLO